MKWSTVIVSTGLHVALAVSLVTVAERKGLGKKTISVAVTSEKKKDKPKPPPPKPIVKPAAPKKVEEPKPEAPTPSAARAPAHAPMATNLAMSNDSLDIGPGIGLHGSVKPTAPAPSAVKVASAISDRRRREAEQAAGGEAPCDEEPTKPEAVVKGALDYTLYPQAQNDGIEGKFKARLTVDESGEVVKVEVLAGIEPGFDAAIVAALQKWRFKPAMACGKPVGGGTFVVQRTFELGD